jgi:hypothetical protein
MAAIPNDSFDRSIRRQIEINRARTPTQRMQALCDLLDAARAMAPRDEAARQRRLRAARLRDQDRERRHAQFRRFLAAQRPGDPAGL